MHIAQIYCTQLYIHTLKHKNIHTNTPIMYKMHRMSIQLVKLTQLTEKVIVTMFEDVYCNVYFMLLGSAIIHVYAEVKVYCYMQCLA